ncbi:DUF3244 domain-containing protein [Parabacteroides faecis]|uniref:DUF3244 domain-containing protein n=1 Tax=Parabacteroides faecis TaxID=1217282 RepID=UPI003522B464
MAKSQKKLTWAMCVLFVFSSLLLQSVSAEGNRSIPFCGKWDEDTRSISSSIPIFAFVNEDVLSIHNTKRSDMIICISKDGTVLYEEAVPAPETGCITIDLSEFEPGTYSVELKNQWGGCLLGKFLIN